MNRKIRIIVAGLVGLYPVGGVAWDYLQYMIGLHRLGHDVYYYEDTWSWPYHPLKNSYVEQGEYSAKFINEFFKRYEPDLINKWHYSHLHKKAYGVSYQAFEKVAKNADIFLNVSGACLIPEKLSKKCIKIFVDTDPGYNQIMLSEKHSWSENIERWCKNVREHNQHFTYAENINSKDCAIPRGGLKWQTTRMPIVLDLWKSKVDSNRRQCPWTTIMTWNAFKGKLLFGGKEYKSKNHEFPKILNLPKKFKVPMEVAVGGKNAPLKQIAKGGWKVMDGPRVTRTPAQYQKFIKGARGEISIAKHVYVAMKTGWFSCRSACYLAAGKPVVVQDTGFSKFLPVRKGILTFDDARGASCEVRSVELNYKEHSKAARAVAVQYFDSRIVLSDLLAKIGKGK